MSESTTVSVKILDKEYQVSCQKDEVEALSASARYLDQQMRQIRESGKVFGLDRIAVMAALQLAHELLGARGGAVGAAPAGDVMKRIRRMTEELDEEIKRQESLF